MNQIGPIVLIAVCVILMSPVVIYFVVLPFLPSGVRTSVQKQFCRIGWHQTPYETVPAPSDMAPEMLQYYHWQPRCICPCCGYEGIVDSQGNLF